MMMQYLADYSKGQIKIQEMAFVLVAFVVFFSMVLLFYVSFRNSTIKQEVVQLQDDKARSMIQKLASSPELSFWSCAGCMDIDKAFLIKNKREYDNFWGLDYLKIERVHPIGNQSECSLANYPDCKTITLRKVSENIGTPATSFVSLCRQNFEQGGYIKCELGRVYASGKAIS
jgi:hypothetical protein